MYGVDGMARGLQSPSSTIQRAWHRIGNRRCRAIQPVSNAYEDAAQTTGGRNTHGDKSARPGRPRRTLVPAEASLTDPAFPSQPESPHPRRPHIGVGSELRVVLMI